MAGQQHTGSHCGQTQPLTINKNKPRHGKQTELLASHHPQTNSNKESHLPQGRITEWSLKLISTLLQHCPVLVWQQQRPHRSRDVPAKGCHKPQARPCCSQADHLACPGGDPTFTGLQMMLLLAGASPSLGHRVAVAAQDLKTFLNALHRSRIIHGHVLVFTKG